MADIFQERGSVRVMPGCNCANSDSSNIGHTSFSLDPKLPETRKFLQKNGFDLSAVGYQDLHMHRLTGDANGVPLWPAQMISIETTKLSAKAVGRRFMARLYEEFVDFEMTVKSAGGSVVDVAISFFSPSPAKVPNFSFKMDMATGWVLKTSPDIRGLKPGENALTGPQRMAYLAANDEQEWDWHCLIHIILHVGGVCSILCIGALTPTGIGQLGCLAAFLLCASPAVLAAIAGCKKQPSA